MRTVGHRRDRPITYSASAELLVEGARFNDEIHLLPTGNLTFIPKGVTRFSTHEEANQDQLNRLVDGMARIAEERFRELRARNFLAKDRGFTLTELAVVLVIVALMIGGLLLPLAAQDNIRRTQETQQMLTDARDALVGYAVSRGRLPCPDNNQDGMEDPLPPSTSNNSPVAGQSTVTYFGCATPEGDLPFATLGTQRSDSWGNRLRYRVTPIFSQVTLVYSGLNATGNIISATPTFTLNTAGNITIQTRGDDPTTPPPAIESKSILNLATNVPAVIISLGKNGFGATNADGTVLPAPPARNVDQATNIDVASATKLTRTVSPTVSLADPCSDTTEGQPSCEFDDIVVWLSPNILFNRMIAAGRLP
jgi:prepilin-type N-terminal cleavage/methylation domain-containing protein